MSAPKLVPYTDLPAWAPTASYPAGPQEWAGDPTKIAPLATYYTPEDETAAQHHNYMLAGLTGSALGASAKLALLEGLARSVDPCAWSGAPLVRHSGDTAEVFDPCWDDSQGAWAVPTLATGGGGAVYMVPPGGGTGYEPFWGPTMGAPSADYRPGTGACWAASSTGATAKTVMVAFDTVSGTAKLGYKATPASAFAAVALTFTVDLTNPMYTDVFWSPRLATFVIMVCAQSGALPTTRRTKVWTYDGTTLTDRTAVFYTGLATTKNVMRMFWHETANETIIGFAGERVASLTRVGASFASVTNPPCNWFTDSGSSKAILAGIASVSGKLIAMASSTFDGRTQLATSTDGGTTWVVGTLNGASSYTRVSRFGNIGETLFAFAKGIANEWRVHYSDDYGATWRPAYAATLDTSNTLVINLGYYPLRGGMLALADAKNFKSTLPTYQDGSFALTP